uniref:Uncharacterized protein n=1 Tax=Xiphophorus maculatus TaxID=8083 RepID=A0A3B5QQ86_XIPMA
LIETPPSAHSGCGGTIAFLGHLSYYIKNLTELSGLHAKSYMWPKQKKCLYKNAFPLVKHSDGGIMTGGSFSSVWTGKQFSVDGEMAGAKKKKVESCSNP